MKKGLLLGNYTDYQWHDLAKCDAIIVDFLSDIAVLEATEDYNTFSTQDFEKYDVILIHSMRFDFSKAMMRALICYVIHGGALVVFHASALTLYSLEFSQMIGAAFKMHPPYRKVEYVAAQGSHPIMADVQPFQLDDEPFQYHFDSITETDVFLHYRHEGTLATCRLVPPIREGSRGLPAARASVPYLENRAISKSDSKRREVEP